ncbi:MAG: DNA-processing protein DprA [Saccharofermentans sp.]|nr:DNA-processing protein DprA [Saccharofermentans sp.]
MVEKICAKQMSMKLEYIGRGIGSMDDKGISLLETVAIRNVGKLNYKAVQELKSTGTLDSSCHISLGYLKSVLKNCSLSDRTSVGVRECINNTYKINHAIEKYIGIIEKEKLWIIPSYDKDYPYEWKNLTGMPEIVFAKGNKNILSDITSSGAVSIVGSRKPGRYAEYATEEFSKNISLEGIAIVSGLALGIDASAHKACLKAEGKTVAIIPCGADGVYPYQNIDLYREISAKGVIISELPPGEPVIKQYFPARNRLISALSDSCLIMEAGMYSGTLHTASFAAAQGKDVFVLPNSIYSENSIGGLELLRDGAEVLIDSDTVIERVRGEVEKRRMLMGSSFPEKNKSGERTIEVLRTLAKKNKDLLSEKEWKRVVLDEISAKPINIDDLSSVLAIPISFLASLVSELETTNQIENRQGKYVLTIPRR